MNVAELIEELSNYPGNIEVRGAWEGIHNDIASVTLGKDFGEREIVLLDVDKHY